MAIATVVAFSSMTFAVDNGNDAKNLKFGEDGKFIIMHVTDTHLEEYNLEASVWAIGEACDFYRL